MCGLRNVYTIALLFGACLLRLHCPGRPPFVLFTFVICGVCVCVCVPCALVGVLDMFCLACSRPAFGVGICFALLFGMVFALLVLIVLVCNACQIVLHCCLLCCVAGSILSCSTFGFVACLSVSAYLRPCVCLNLFLVVFGCLDLSVCPPSVCLSGCLQFIIVLSCHVLSCHVRLHLSGCLTFFVCPSACVFVCLSGSARLCFCLSICAAVFPAIAHACLCLNLSFVSVCLCLLV